MCRHLLLFLVVEVIFRMSFAGNYELQSHENFEVFMKAIGLPDELIQKGKDVKSVSQIVQDGKHFKVTVTTGTKVQYNEFNIGEETELETITGEKVKSVVNLIDNKLVVQLKKVTSITELTGDILTSVLILGDISYTRISKRV
ncbi:fatty acid-binding protein 1, liver-like [Discoglossus pictus]